MDPLEKIIRPIVEGQIRGFLKEHSAIVEAVDWYKPRDDKAVTFVNSLSKRIIRDLVCPSTRARVMAALLEFGSEAPSDVAVALRDCGNGAPPGTPTGRGVYSSVGQTVVEEK